MFIQDYMTKKLVTVTPETAIFDAVDLMKSHQIHRLPVIQQNRLVGLITEGTIQTAMPSKATSLSVYEMNYLLNQMTVNDVMVKKVHTISADELLEAGVAVMRQAKIGVLPVLDNQQKLCGIITNNDIFDAFLEITGYNQPGTRIAIQINQDHEGVLAELTNLFYQHHINIVQLVVYRSQSQPMIVCQLTNPDADLVAQMIKDGGYDVISSIATQSIC